MACWLYGLISTRGKTYRIELDMEVFVSNSYKGMLIVCYDQYHISS